MKIRSKEYGRIDIREEDVIVFVKPILCFEECTRYVLLESREYAGLYSLQSVEKFDVAFVVAEPSRFVKDWTPQFDYEEALLEMVGAGSLSECVFFAVLNLTRPGRPTMNLLGPLLVHPAGRLAAQGISARPGDAPDHRIYLKIH